MVMKRPSHALLLVQLVVCISSAVSRADDSTAEIPVTFLAVIDIDKVLENHVRLQDELEKLASERQEFTKSHDELKQKLNEKAGYLDQYKRLICFSGNWHTSIVF
jgi:Skp family chaperone for outer membrane proteins